MFDVISTRRVNSDVQPDSKSSSLNVVELSQN